MDHTSSSTPPPSTPRRKRIRDLTPEERRRQRARIRPALQAWKRQFAPLMQSWGECEPTHTTNN